MTASCHSSLNYKEIDLLLSAMDLTGARVREFFQPRPDVLIMGMYHQGQIMRLGFFMCQPACRFHFYSGPVDKRVTRQRFVSFLLSRLKEARLERIEQIQSERIMKMTFRRDEDTSFLWVRLWSSAPNIIYTDAAGRIGDALYRRPKKKEISGGHFNPEEEFMLHPPRPVSGSRFTIRDFGGNDTMTVHQKVEAYFMESENQKQEVDLRERILNQLAVEERRVRKAIQATDDWFAAHQDVERLKQCGDILMSNLTHVPAGAAWFEGKDFFHNDNTVKISLDKELSGAANAKKYYSEYKKKKIACERKRVERSELSRRLKGINDNIKHVADTHDVLKLQTMARRLDKKKQSVSSQDTPGLSFISGGYTILVGRTAKENEELYRRHVRGNDLWMHTRDFPGASVFIRSIRGKSEPLEVILDAANLAVFYSKAKSSGKADLYYTRVKYLKKAKGGKTGLFLPTQEKNLNVRLDQERIRRLKYKDETID